MHLKIPFHQEKDQLEFILFQSHSLFVSFSFFHFISLSLLRLIAKGKKEDADEVQAAATSWGSNFLACGEVGLRGFQPPNFTPYAHLIKDHAPHMVRQLGGLGRFSGERLEKLNDEFKTTFHKYIFGKKKKDKYL